MVFLKPSHPKKVFEEVVFQLEHKLKKISEAKRSLLLQTITL